MDREHLPQIHETRLSAVQFFSGEFRKAIEAIPNEILQMSEIELYDTGKITQTDWFLRKNLWNLIESAQKSNENAIPTSAIYRGITSHQNFFQQIVHNQIRLAWLLIKPTALPELIDEATYFGLKRLRHDLLTMPMNEKSAPVFLKAVEFLANRAWGPVIQRIEAKHAHLDLGTRINKEPTYSTNPEDVAKRLAELKRKLAATDV
jgi:hypothetical protein